MKKKTLGFKLVFGGIMVVLIPLLVVGLYASIKASSALEELALSQSAEIAKSLAGTADVAVQEELKIVTQLSLMDTVIDAAAKHAQGNDGLEVDKAGASLTALVKSAGEEYEVIFLADTKGKVFADGVNGKYKGIDLSDRDYVKAALTGKVNAGSVVKSKGSGLPVLTFAAPVYSPSKELVGVVGTAPKITFLTNKIDAVKLGKTGFAFVVNKEGAVLAHPQKDLVLSFNMREQEGMKELVGKMLAGQTGSERYTFKGIKKVAGYAPATSANWFVGVGQNYDELAAPAHAIRNFIIILGIIFLAGTIVAITFFARSISRPIQNAVEQMTEAANQVASAAAEVSSASQSLAEGASSQAAAIEETSSSIEELSSMTKQNAGNAGHADGLMKDARTVIQTANDLMEHLTGSMADITTASEETSKIVKTIDEISFQTNLLALNAAVEAARAGEAGAGFAVVAEEVRSLAIRAAEAAKNTAGLIEGTVKKIMDGSDLVMRTNQIFTDVSSHTSKVNELVGEIAAASQEQSQGIDQINKAVTEMDKVAQETASSAEESASASEEMNAQAEQMKQISMALLGIIGGDTSNLENSCREDAGPRRGVRGVVAAVTAGKKSGRSMIPMRKGVEIRPDQVIPMNEENEFR